MFVVLSVPAEEADKVDGNSSCEETMALTENCRCIVVLLHRCTTGPERSRLCGDGLLPSVWIVQLTLPMWIGVCASVTQSFANAIQLRIVSPSNCVLYAQGAPVSQMDMYRCVGHKGMRMESN